MVRIRLVPEVLDDFEVDDPAARIDQTVPGLDVLAHSPLIGRKLHGDLRELVIGKATRGCVALYRYVPTLDTVFVLAIRGQRKSGN